MSRTPFQDVRQGAGQLAGGPSPFLALHFLLPGLIQRLDEATVVARLLLDPAITPGPLSGGSPAALPLQPSTRILGVPPL
jgi:hypothetical protein